MRAFGQPLKIVHMADTPIGESCSECEQPIAADDDGFLLSRFEMVSGDFTTSDGHHDHVAFMKSETPVHRECFLAAINEHYHPKKGS